MMAGMTTERIEQQIEQKRLDAERLLGVPIDPDVWRKSQMQQLLASEGCAENQCPCGNYTLTGEPPQLHRDDCSKRWIPLGSVGEGRFFWAPLSERGMMGV